MRATICAIVDNSGEVEIAKQWLAEHQNALSHVSDEGGCGCCVVTWDIEGPESIVSTLPAHLSAGTAWVSDQKGFGDV